jgi:tRNA G18 (ribose-2'-O)-methylase SpoU
MKYRKLKAEEILKAKKSIDEIKKFKRTPIYGILDNIRSLYNVGSMFRTADGALLEKLYLCGMTGIPPRKEIEKTSLGAVEVVPWEYKKSAASAVKELKEKGVEIIVLELAEPKEHYAEIDIKFPAALVVGHEIEGVSEEIIKIADKVIYIPMLGRANSLNVAIAFGIGIYEMLYKYKKKQHDQS